MRLVRMLLAAMLLLPVPVLAGQVEILPAAVVDGGTAMVRWTGSPPAVGVVRFQDRPIYLYPAPGGAVALLPVPLATPEGSYPLTGVIVDAFGAATPWQADLRVRHEQRPLERLTLPEGMVSPRKPEVLARIGREQERLEEIFQIVSARSWDRFVRPVDDPVSSVFGKRRLLNGQPRAPHSGTDFRSPSGTPVRAISAGRAVLVDDLFFTGQTVIIDHGEGLFSIYAHLSATGVATGDTVATGSIIGKVGSSGRSTGPHLHLSLRLLGVRVDPLQFLALFQSPGS